MNANNGNNSTGKNSRDSVLIVEAHLQEQIPLPLEDQSIPAEQILITRST